MSCWFAVSNFIIVCTKSLDLYSDSFEHTISPSPFSYFHKIVFTVKMSDMVGIKDNYYGHRQLQFKSILGFRQWKHCIMISILQVRLINTFITEIVENAPKTFYFSNFYGGGGLAHKPLLRDGILGLSFFSGLPLTESRLKASPVCVLLFVWPYTCIQNISSDYKPPL